MDIKRLQTFTVLARTRNFHQAAAKLYLAQPTVSQHIRLLEEELGITLFTRLPRQVQLTPAGERFLPHAQSVLDAWAAGMQDLARWRQGFVERVVVAASPVVARSVLPRILARFAQTHPAVDLTLRVALTPEIGPLVDSGDATLGLSRLMPAERSLTGTLLYADPVLLVAARDAGDLDAPPPDWRELLSQQTLMTHNHPGYWDDLLLALQHLQVHPRAMVVSQVDITKRLIEEGLGLSFLPHSAVWRELVEGRLMEVPTPGLVPPTAGTYLVQRGGEELHAGAAALVQLLEEMLKRVR